MSPLFLFCRLLRHDNIVAYRGNGVYGENKDHFVVMEYIKASCW